MNNWTDPFFSSLPPPPTSAAAPLKSKFLSVGLTFCAL